MLFFSGGKFSEVSVGGADVCSDLCLDKLPETHNHHN